MSAREREAVDWFARMRGPGADESRDQFENWRRDPSNAAAFARVEDDWDLAGNVSRRRIAPDTPAAPVRRSRLGWALAMVVAALALGTAWSLLPNREGTQLAEAAAAGREIRLPDGSRAFLMDGARIDSGFSDGERRIVMTGGRARFHVAKDPKRPFRVIAGGAETVALGTIFEVDLRRALPRVNLVEGEVEVRAARGAPAPLRLVAGESAEFVGNRAVRLSDLASPVSASFLDAERLPLGAVIDRANRAANVPIRLADPALASRPVTGRFDAADGRMLARQLAAALDLEIAEEGNMIVLRAHPE